MPAWNDHKTAARDRGALALELCVVRTRPGEDRAAVEANLPAHPDCPRALEEAGHPVMAGPLSDESGDNMYGACQIVYRAASMEAARDLADNDPMHKSGARTFTLRKWLVNEGHLSNTIGLSTKLVDLR